MSDEDLDPEVLADLRLRASSEHDGGRARPSRAAIGTWRPDPIAGMWRCRGRNRANPCPQNTMVGVTAEVIERLMIFNARLRKMGEDPIDTAEVVRCEPCRRAIADARPALLRKRCDEVAECIRQLKNSNDPRKERELIKQLEAWGHPDVPGLLQFLDEKRRAGKGQRVSKESI